MWRVGNANSSNAKVKKLVISEKPKNADKKNEERKKRPANSNKFGNMIDPSHANETKQARRGSILAAEHLAHLRTTKNKALDLPHIATARRDSVNVVKAGGVPLDHLRSQRVLRRGSVVQRLEKVKQIKERINQVFSDFDDAGDGEDKSRINEILSEIETGIENIEDDMMRINVGMLIGNYRKTAKKLEVMEERAAHEVINTGNEEKSYNILSSVQDWLDQDHMEDINADDPIEGVVDSIDEFIDSDQIVDNDMKRMKEQLEKLASLKKHIRKLKLAGKNTATLEVQRQNLQSEVKQDVGILRVKKELRKNSTIYNEDDLSRNAREFNYLKSATTEVYDVIKRSRMEGMAAAHQFEEQLKKILIQVEQKEKEAALFHSQIDKNKKLLDKWKKDYEKLQDENMLNIDERNIYRKEARDLKQELRNLRHEMKRKSSNAEETVTLAQHEKKVHELEGQLQEAKQKLEVINWSCKEKDGNIEDLQKQISRLKNSLKKSANLSQSTEALYKPVHSSSTSTTINRRSNIGVSIFDNTPPSSPEIALSEENLVLKEEVKYLSSQINTLRKESNTAIVTGKVKMGRVVNRIVETKSVGTQALASDINETNNMLMATSQCSLGESQLRISITPRNFPLTQDTASQTITLPRLPYMTPHELANMQKLSQEMSEKMGDKWIDAATKLTELESADIEDLSRGLSCEEDLIQMYTGTAAEIHQTAESRSTTPVVLAITDGKSSVEVASPLQKESAFKISEGIERLTEGMLSGHEPEELESQNVASITALHTEVDEITDKITQFISRTQNVISGQTSMMNEANSAIKSSLPGNVLNKLKKSKTKLNTDNHGSTIEFNPPAVHDKIHHQMRMIEDRLQSAVRETMGVYINEVAKQHADYSNIHTTMKEELKTGNINHLVAQPKRTMYAIKEQVENTMEQHEVKNKIGRYRNTFATDSDKSMGEGGVRKKTPGLTISSMFKYFQLQKAPLKMLGSAPSKYDKTSVARTVSDDKSVKVQKKPWKELKEVNLRKNKLKVNMVKTRGLGMGMVMRKKRDVPPLVLRGVHQDSIPSILPDNSTTVQVNRLNPVYASNLPKVSSFTTDPDIENEAEAKISKQSNMHYQHLYAAPNALTKPRTADPTIFVARASSMPIYATSLPMHRQSISQNQHYSPFHHPPQRPRFGDLATGLNTIVLSGLAAKPRHIEIKRFGDRRPMHL